MIVARRIFPPDQTADRIATNPRLDVGSIEYIHGRIISKRDEGTAVLLVSSELDEILALSDRIAVVYRGQIVDIVRRQQGVSKEYLGLLMAGIRTEKLKPPRSQKGEKSGRVF